jgi:hypothetical protein
LRETGGDPDVFTKSEVLNFRMDHESMSGAMWGRIFSREIARNALADEVEEQEGRNLREWWLYGNVPEAVREVGNVPVAGGKAGQEEAGQGKRSRHLREKASWNLGMARRSTARSQMTELSPQGRKVACPSTPKYKPDLGANEEIHDRLPRSLPFSSAKGVDQYL